MEEGQEQSLGRGVESGQTYPPRALLEVGGSTPEGGQGFHVREDLANERQ